MTLYYSDDQLELHHGDALDVLRTLPDGSVNSCVTSPPYFGLRDYGEPGQYGLEASPAEYVETMRSLFAEVRRVLANDGTLWLNLGDSFATTSTYNAPRSMHNEAGWKQAGQGPRANAGGATPKNLLGIPWRVAFALQDDGWNLRNAIIWNKPNAMPESVTDRLSCRYEHLFLFSKSRRYWFDLDPIREPLAYPDAADGTRVFGGKNKGNTGGVDSTLRRRGGKPWTRTTPQTAAAPATDADGSGRTDSGTPDRAQPTSAPTSSSAAKADSGRSYDRYGAVRPWANSEQSGSDHDATAPAGRNPGDVWTISTKPFSEAHFAVMPPELAERCILAGCRPGGTVLDPFSGSGTTGMVAQRHGRKYVGIDLNKDYLELSLRTRLQQAALNFEDGGAA